MSASRSFPPQSGSYRLQVKNGAGWHAFDAARLQISVGQPYHEGEKLAATVDWIGHRFDRAIVCVNDTLQRHNLMFEGMAEPRALRQCIENGTRWIDRNRAALARLPKLEIHRFEDWRRQPGFERELGRLRSLHASDPLFRVAIEDEVRSFWQRRIRSTGLSEAYRFAAFAQHSTDYLLEETAAFFLMFEQDRAVDIYPGSTLLPHTLAPAYGYGPECHFTRIDFKRRDPLRLEAA